MVPVLPRSINWAPDSAAYQSAVARLDRAGAPVFDHCRGTLAVDREHLEEGWRTLVAELPPGITHLALHCTAPDEFASMAPDHAGWRYAEYDWILGGGLQALCAAAGVATVGTRAVQKLWLAKEWD
jgi:hypothetical protein